MRINKKPNKWQILCFFLAGNGGFTLLILAFTIEVGTFPSLFSIFFCYLISNIIYASLMWYARRDNKKETVIKTNFDMLDGIRYPLTFRNNVIFRNFPGFNFRKPTLNTDHFRLSAQALKGLKGTREFEGITTSNYHVAMTYLRLGKREEAKDIVFWAIEKGDITEKIGREIIERIDVVSDPPKKRNDTIGWI